MRAALSVLCLAVTVFGRPDVNEIGEHPSNTYIPAEYGAPSNGYLPTPEEDEQKHVYFYGSADDGHYTKLHINVIPKSHKSTKVIFVKAPYHAGVIPEVVNPPSSAEHKTLVYVLMKKPIESQSVTIPAGLGVKQHKPDVFFVKYKTKHDAEHQIQDGLLGQVVGNKVPNLENEHAFLGAFGGNAEHGYPKHVPYHY